MKLTTMLRVAFCFLVSAASPALAQFNTGTLTITGVPVNTSTITISSPSATVVFNWTNGTPIGSLSMLITNSFGGDATNLTAVTQLLLPANGVVVTQVSSNVVTFQAVGLSGSITSGWGTFTVNTTTTGGETNVIVPISNLASASRASVETQLASDLDQYAIYSLKTNSPLLQLYVDLFNAQTLSNKSFVFSTNTGGVFNNPVLNNAQNFGNPFRSPGTGTGSEQFGLAAVASASGAVAFGDGATASATDSTAIGFGAAASGIGSSASGENAMAGGIGSTAVGINSVAGPANSTTAIGFNAQATGSGAQAFGLSALATNTDSLAVGGNAVSTNVSSTALGKLSATTTDHQVMLGTSSEYVDFPGGVLHQGQDTNLLITGTSALLAQFSIPQKAISSIANSNNADLPIGTNTTFQLSGNTGPFYIAGIQGGVPGREIELENFTGQIMVIGDNSGVESVDVTRRIRTGYSADRQFTNQPGVVKLRYSSTDSRWHIVSVN